MSKIYMIQDTGYLYMNDLNKAIIHSTTHDSADDTNLLLTVSLLSERNV